MQKAESLAMLGPSGIGKATLCLELINIHPVFAVVGSYTTRKAKLEKHGKKYINCSTEEFLDFVASGKICEYNFYDGHYYGTSLESYQSILAKGKVPLLDIDINGLIQMKQKKISIYSDFLEAEIEEIEERLTLRGTETPESIRSRMETTSIEIPKAKELQKSKIIDRIQWYGKGCIESITANEIFNDFFY